LSPGKQLGPVDLVKLHAPVVQCVWNSINIQSISCELRAAETAEGPVLVHKFNMPFFTNLQNMQKYGQGIVQLLYKRVVHNVSWKTPGS
jgi:hypothetical protein